MKAIDVYLSDPVNAERNEFLSGKFGPNGCVSSLRREALSMKGDCPWSESGGERRDDSDEFGVKSLIGLRLLPDWETIIGLKIDELLRDFCTICIFNWLSGVCLSIILDLTIASLVGDPSDELQLRSPLAFGSGEELGVIIRSLLAVVSTLILLNEELSLDLPLVLSSLSLRSLSAFLHLALRFWNNIQTSKQFNLQIFFWRITEQKNSILLGLA